MCFAYFYLLYMMLIAIVIKIKMCLIYQNDNSLENGLKSTVKIAIDKILIFLLSSIPRKKLFNFIEIKLNLENNLEYAIADTILEF